MKLWSDAWTNGDRIPQRYAAGRPDGSGGASFGDLVEGVKAAVPGAGMKSP